MYLKDWSELPDYMRTPEVREYYDIISKRKKSLIMKRIFDVLISSLMLLILSPIMLIIAVMIKIDSKGPVFFRQQRITRYGNTFRIFKFRSMVTDAEKLGAQVTSGNDSRITHMGRLLRKGRLDEIPQLINILKGEMTFVGTRPEVKRYVDCYDNEMYATLLLPAGLTSRTSIEYKDEDKLLEGAEDVDAVYVSEILPAKMKYNLENVRSFSMTSDMATMFATFVAVLR